MLPKSLLAFSALAVAVLAQRSSVDDDLTSLTIDASVTDEATATAEETATTTATGITTHTVNVGAVSLQTDLLDPKIKH